MRIITRLGAPILLAAPYLFAAPLCTTGPLSTYISSGYACEYGTTVFSNFEFSSTGALAASSITVTPIASAVNRVGLQFAGDFAAKSNGRTGETATYALSYLIVSGPAARPYPILSRTQTVDGGGVHRNGTYTATEIVRSPAGAAISSSAITQSGSQTLEAPFPPGSEAFYRVENTIVLNAPGDAASNRAYMTGITNLFNVQTPDPPTASLILGGVALLIGGRVGRRRLRLP